MLAGSGLGLGSIKLESPSYFLPTNYTANTSSCDTTIMGPSSVAQLITANYGTLSLAPAARVASPTNTVTVDTSGLIRGVDSSGGGLIRVKRMRRMSSEEHDKTGAGHVSELQYYTGSPLSASPTWTQEAMDHSSSIGET